MGPIAVEMPPAPAGNHERPAEEAALLRACSEASAPQRCVRASELQGTAEVIAVVSWNGDLEVRIEVAERARARWLERTLTFAEGDPPIERWEAAGLAIGTLLSHADPADEAKAATSGGALAVTEAPRLTKETPTEGTRRARAAGEPAEPRKGRKTPGKGTTLVYGDAGIRAGSAWGDTLRLGPTVLVGTRLPPGWFFDVELDLTLSHNRVTPPGVSLTSTFWGAGLGTGMSWQAAPSTLAEFGIFPGLEHIQTTSDGTTGQPGRVLGHVEGKLRLRQRVAGPFWLRFSANFGVRLGETGIFVDGTEVGTIPLMYGGLSLAASFDVLKLGGAPDKGGDEK